MDEVKLRRLGEDDYGIDDAFALTPEQVIETVMERQDQPHWVDGIVLRAAKRGEVLVLDEINLLRPAVLARLRSLFDDVGNLRVTEHRQKVVVPDANFRFVATGNPTNYQGREALSEADLDRFSIIEAFGLTQSYLTRIMLERYGDVIPVEELTKLIKIHDAIARAADAGGDWPQVRRPRVHPSQPLQGGGLLRPLPGHFGAASIGADAAGDGGGLPRRARRAGRHRRRQCASHRGDAAQRPRLLPRAQAAQDGERLDHW